MKQLTQGKKLLCVLLAAVMLGLTVPGIPVIYAEESSSAPASSSTATSSSASSQVDEDAKQAAQDKVNELQQQLDAEKKELQKTQQKSKDAQAAKKSYQTQSGIVKQQIQELTVMLDETEAAIAQKQNEVDQKQAEIDARWEEFKDQMAAMQMMNDAGAVAMLSSVKSLYELLTFGDVLQQISKKQNQVLDEMKQHRDELKAIQTELEAKKTELEGQQEKLDAKKQELATSIRQADATISQADAEAAAQQVQVDATNEALRQAREEFNQYINSLPNSGAAFVGEDFIWPTVSNRITQHFGGSSNHGGLDIGAATPGAAGDPIYAAASGVVQVAAYHNHRYSYGNYVVIDHGGGIKTLYAHMTNFVVSPGQNVNQGDVIGYMGNTGYSQGVHLHYEVRVNGSRVNPMGYYHKA